MAEHLIQQRCEVTRNQCGSDTWSQKPCSCDQCQRWVLAVIGGATARVAGLEAALEAASEFLAEAQKSACSENNRQVAKLNRLEAALREVPAVVMEFQASMDELEFHASYTEGQTFPPYPQCKPDCDGCRIYKRRVAAKRQVAELLLAVEKALDAH